MKPFLAVKIKTLHPDAAIPYQGSDQAAGLDMVATSVEYDVDYVTYGTGIAMQIPPGYAGFLFPRSSVYKTGMSLTNCVGVIDSDYRGEIKAKFYLGGAGARYGIGDRIVQLVIMPVEKVAWDVVDELDETERGEGGFGSTGK